MRLFLKFLLALVAVYLVAVVGLAWAMRQTPERFGRIMARMPAPGYIVLPFETLWTNARAGNLQIGDPAPDFNLQTLDKSARVQLASFRGSKPVVLVFGSYT